MNDEIRVHVQRKGRQNFYMRYRCPDTGADYSRSTGTANRKEAERVAARWEAALRSGADTPTPKMGWQAFRTFYEDTVGPTLRPRTQQNYATSLDAFQRLCKPAKLSGVTTAVVTSFSTKLRAEGVAEATIASYLRGLKAAIRFAGRQGLVSKLPNFDMPKRVAKAKARGITAEEFERMLTAAPKVMAKRTKPEAVESWRTLLKGLWWSGLRLGEALALRFDYEPGGVMVRLDGPRSVLVFDPESQKSGEAETVPLAPEAVKLIESLPHRDGYVFRPLRFDTPRPMARDIHKVCGIISEIGDKAGVVVNPRMGKPASAHDLRRSFGYRWSRRVMPRALKTLMRHASIETTMTFYVDQQAETTAAELWAAVDGDFLGTPAQTEASDSRKPLVLK